MIASVRPNQLLKTQHRMETSNVRDPLLTRDDRAAVRWGYRYSLKWLVALIVTFVAIGWALWAFGVFTSDVRGRGEAIKTKNSGTNRIAAQERFEDLAADVGVSAQRIDTLAAAAKATPSYAAQTAATGAVTYCQSLVAQYNADARKYTARQFRSADLPESFDASTTCTGAAS